MKSKPEPKAKFAYRLAYRAMRSYYSGYALDEFYFYQYNFVKEYAGLTVWENASSSFYDSDAWTEDNSE